MFFYERRAVLLAVVMTTGAQGACASTARREASTLPSSDRDVARIAELESRIAELEASLARARAESSQHPAIRIDDASASEATVEESASDGALSNEPPVVIRLDENHGTNAIPGTSERLAVVPMPAFAPLGATVASTASTPIETEDTAEYRTGLAHLTGRRYEAAIGSLSAFLRDHPGSERADDALYWRATASYALRRYDAALVDYERVPQIAPRGEHAADALYHAGLCHVRLGAAARAAAYFARVRREYPDSVAARLAAREDAT